MTRYTLGNYKSAYYVLFIYLFIYLFTSLFIYFIFYSLINLFIWKCISFFNLHIKIKEVVRFK